MPMNDKRCEWSRERNFVIVVIVFSIVMMITLYGTSWASTTPMIAGGGGHKIALKSDGTVWAWGNNGWGQLGDGTITLRTTPVLVSGLSGVTAIACGGNHSIALKSDGTVWAWGLNYHGQLGEGTTADMRTTPAQVSGLSGVIAIAGGGEHSIALKSDGTVWVWGDNDYGQLGDGTYRDRIMPAPVSGINLGTSATPTPTPSQTPLVTPSPPPTPSDTTPPMIASGGYHTIALKSDGTVWAWGRNRDGRLGDGTTTQRIAPIQVSGLSGVIAITGGEFHTIALKSDGTVWTWGYNYNGQLGDGTTTNRKKPVQVSGLSSVTAIAGGSNHTIALKSDGTVWTWGLNDDGQLGDGTITQRTTPVQVSGINLGTSPTPTVTPSNTAAPTPTPAVSSKPTSSPTPVEGSIYGHVLDVKGVAVESVKLTLRNVSTRKTQKASSDEDGFFEFEGLEAGTYRVTAKKKGYRQGKKTVRFESGEEEIEIMLRKMPNQRSSMYAEPEIDELAQERE